MPATYVTPPLADVIASLPDRSRIGEFRARLAKLLAAYEDVPAAEIHDALEGARVAMARRAHKERIK